MKIQSILFLALILFVSHQMFGQEMDKAEKKKWVSMAKDFKKNPVALKSLVEERNQCRQEVQDLQRQVSSSQNDKNKALQLEQQVNRLNSDLLSAQDMINRLSMENERLKNTAPPQVPSTTPQTSSSGVVFRVQAGAFTKGRVPQNILSMPDVTLEDSGNVQKALVGNYATVAEARARASQLKGQGIDGAFVVAYKNGVRVSIDEALRN